MENYWGDIENKDIIERGMYVILPLTYKQEFSFADMSIMKKDAIDFKSEDFIELLTNKCKKDGDFVRRYHLDCILEAIKKETTIPITDLQLFVFANGIAFLTVYFSYCNKDVNSVYQFIYPGYTDENVTVKSAQSLFLEEIEEKILTCISPKMQWFIKDVDSKSFNLKEAYRLNVAYVPMRFKDTDVVNQVTYNVHRIIELSRDFADASEKDVAYVTSARDVDSEDYGWGCSITSQEISYAYVKGTQSLVERSQEDLLLTMLVMYQKYTCTTLNEEIHMRYTSNENTDRHKKNIQDLKREAMEFVAYGTLSPSQISRWNNVCETYRLLNEMNGLNETIAEIKEKIHLLNEEQEKIDSKRESSIGMIIAVFGLISIVAGLLQIVDYVSTGKIEILVSFTGALTCVLMFGVFLVRGFLKRKRRNGDV